MPASLVQAASVASVGLSGCANATGLTQERGLSQPAHFLLRALLMSVQWLHDHVVAVAGDELEEVVAVAVGVVVLLKASGIDWPRRVSHTMHAVALGTLVVVHALHDHEPSLGFSCSSSSNDGACPLLAPSISIGCSSGDGGVLGTEMGERGLTLLATGERFRCGDITRAEPAKPSSCVMLRGTTARERERERERDPLVSTMQQE